MSRVNRQGIKGMPKVTGPGSKKTGAQGEYKRGANAETPSSQSKGVKSPQQGFGKGVISNSDTGL